MFYVDMMQNYSVYIILGAVCIPFLRVCIDQLNPITNLHVLRSILQIRLVLQYNWYTITMLHSIEHSVITIQMFRCCCSL